MSLLRINVATDSVSLHNTPQPVARRLRSFASHPGPVVIMIHGYKYRPGSEHHCPHRKILGDADNYWPAQLQIGRTPHQDGTSIALGWDARGTLRDVYSRARHVSKRLATIVAMLRQHAPARPVHIIAHSLGSELALSTLDHLPAHSVNRMILLTGASYAQRARHMLKSPAGRTVEVLNVTSRENDLFDLAFERLIPVEAEPDQSIGLGINAPNVVTLQLDCPEALSGLRSIGFDVASPTRRICHWSAYTRPGVMALYSAFLRSPGQLPLDRLASILPAAHRPRWSRLFPGLPQSFSCKRSLQRYIRNIATDENALTPKPENEAA